MFPRTSRSRGVQVCYQQIDERGEEQSLLLKVSGGSLLEAEIFHIAPAFAAFAAELGRCFGQGRERGLKELVHPDDLQARHRTRDDNDIHPINQSINRTCKEALGCVV